MQESPRKLPAKFVVQSSGPVTTGAQGGGTALSSIASQSTPWKKEASLTALASKGRSWGSLCSSCDSSSSN